MAVAPLAGSVDRNSRASGIQRPAPAVAPLAGSVDRNYHENRRCVNPCGRSPRGERG